MAIAIPAVRTPRAAIAETTRMPVISRSCPRERSGLEDGGLERFAALREVIEMDRSVTGRGVVTGGVSFGVDSCLAEEEKLLELRLAVHKARDLRDADDLSRASAHTLCLHYHVDRGSDLFLDRPCRQVGATHQHHRLQTAECVVWRVGVDGAHRTFVTGVHGLQHVEGPSP